MKKFLIASLASLFLAGFVIAGEAKECKACKEKGAACEKCEKAAKSCDKDAKKACCGEKKADEKKADVKKDEPAKK